MFFKATKNAKFDSAADQAASNFSGFLLVWPGFVGFAIQATAWADVEDGCQDCKRLLSGVTVASLVVGVPLLFFGQLKVCEKLKLPELPEKQTTTTKKNSNDNTPHFC